MTCPFPPTLLQEITIKLRRALYVTGVVFDAAGKPCPDVIVEATLQDKNSMAYVAHDRTDAAGRFQIFDFPIERSETKPRGTIDLSPSAQTHPKHRRHLSAE